MDVFLPLAFAKDPATLRGDENYNVMARLKPGVTLAQADDDVAAIAARIREKDKRDRTFTIDVVSLVESVVGNVRLADSRAARIGHARPADRLRECCKPAAHAGERTSEGSRGPHRARRELAPPRPAAADRERPARCARRRGRTADRLRRVAGRSRDQSRQHSTARRDRSRRDRPGVHAGGLDRDRHPVRPRAGVTCGARGPQLVDEGRRPQHARGRRPRQLPPAPSKSCWSWRRSRSR